MALTTVGLSGALLRQSLSCQRFLLSPGRCAIAMTTSSALHTTGRPASPWQRETPLRLSHLLSLPLSPSLPSLPCIIHSPYNVQPLVTVRLMVRAKPGEARKP